MMQSGNLGIQATDEANNKKPTTKQLPPTDPILVPENLLKTGFAQKGLPTVQETNWDAQREKACVNTYAHASALQICLQNICGQQQKFPMAGPTFGSKSGPQNGAQAKT